MKKKAIYKGWIKKQEGRGRPQRVKDYQAIKRHILKARINQQPFGKIALGLLNISHLKPTEQAQSERA